MEVHYLANTTIATITQIWEIQRKMGNTYRDTFENATVISNTCLGPAQLMTLVVSFYTLLLPTAIACRTLQSQTSLKTNCLLLDNWWQKSRRHRRLHFHKLISSTGLILNHFDSIDHRKPLTYCLSHNVSQSCHNVSYLVELNWTNQ